MYAQERVYVIVLTTVFVDRTGQVVTAMFQSVMELEMTLRWYVLDMVFVIRVINVNVIMDTLVSTVNSIIVLEHCI